MTNYRIIFLFSLITYSSNSYSAQGMEEAAADTKKDEKIEINGISKSMIGHITHAVLNPSTDKFSTTSVFRYYDNRFKELGDLTSLTGENMEFIMSGNYVYVPFFAQLKTRLSGNSYDQVAAIILGTSDENMKMELILHYARVLKFIPFDC